MTVKQCGTTTVNQPVVKQHQMRSCLKLVLCSVAFLNFLSKSQDKDDQMKPNDVYLVCSGGTFKNTAKQKSTTNVKIVLTF